METAPAPETADSQSNVPPPADAAPRPRSFRDAVRAGFKSARADAERTARSAAPKVKAAARQAAYDLSYASAFAGFFGVTIVKEFIPGAVKSGFSEGAKQGRDAADRVASAVATPADEAPPASAPC